LRRTGTTINRNRSNRGNAAYVKTTERNSFMVINNSGPGAAPINPDVQKQIDEVQNVLCELDNDGNFLGESKLY
jgi:hypothetical protein